MLGMLCEFFFFMKKRKKKKKKKKKLDKQINHVNNNTINKQNKIPYFTYIHIFFKINSHKNNFVNDKKI